MKFTELKKALKKIGICVLQKETSPGTTYIKMWFPGEGNRFLSIAVSNGNVESVYFYTKKDGWLDEGLRLYAFWGWLSEGILEYHLERALYIISCIVARYAY